MTPRVFKVFWDPDLEAVIVQDSQDNLKRLIFPHNHKTHEDGLRNAVDYVLKTAQEEGIINYQIHIDY